MANQSIAQAINRTAVARALAQARAECVGHVAWMNAINRAALNLESCRWQFDGDTLVIASASSERRYTVTAEGCECKAYLEGKPCWHRAARLLLVKAAELAQLPEYIERCPMCGAPIEGRQFYVGGTGYVYFDVCAGDGAHFTRKAG